MSAVRQAHAQHGVADVKERKENRKIGVRSAVRLNVGVLATEKFFRAFDGKVFHLVDVNAAAVVSFTGIALGVLVREVRTHSRHHGRTDKILARNKLDIALLPRKLALHRSRNGRVDGRNKFKVNHVISPCRGLEFRCHCSISRLYAKYAF